MGLAFVVEICVDFRHIMQVVGFPRHFFLDDFVAGLVYFNVKLNSVCLLQVDPVCDQVQIVEEIIAIFNVNSFFFKRIQVEFFLAASKMENQGFFKSLA